jgi:hypothetical protein
MPIWLIAVKKLKVVNKLKSIKKTSHRKERRIVIT